MMDLGKKIGSFVSGSFVSLILRQKSKEEFELGQLFIAGTHKDDYSIFQIKDLFYGSQIPESSLELIAGYGLEREGMDLKIYEPELRNYVLAQAKPLINVKNLQLFLPKKLPQFFGAIYEITEDHLQFFKEKRFDDPITLGKVRSGSKVLDINVSVSASEVLRHHVLIPATTGRGKSNLVKVILYNIIENLSCGKLVFDPHNEYYGTPKVKGLKDHPKSNEYVKYYTSRNIPSKLDLKFNVKYLYPSHVLGSIDLSQPQIDALILYYRLFKRQWIQKIFDKNEKLPEGINVITISVLRRKLAILLEFGFDDEENIIENGIYTLDGYESTIEDMINFLVNGRTVIIDTS
ncbi:MAG: helicase HerA domain-containing protein, partial [Promethearchaeota archaeon]